ncbi:MAG: hypothetical protein C5B54_05310 [Acidobacteria bacterium]|nr:MAG: hypothetical protein C5B54_05310 [Acidobacteriota bacterium]
MKRQTAVFVIIFLIASFKLYAESQNDRPLQFRAALIVENDVEVKSRLTGVIEKIFVQRGSHVNIGYPLAQLKNDDLALEVEKALATKKETEAEFQRAKSLQDQQLLSQSDFDSKKLAYEKASADVDLAKVNYEKSIIKAPFSGVVVERYAKIGQRVVEDDNISLFRITAMEPLLARLFVPEEQLNGVSLGGKAEFVANLDTTRRFSAKVKWISDVIDAASGTAAVLVEIAPGQGKGFLKPGLSGLVYLWPTSPLAAKTSP